MARNASLKWAWVLFLITHDEALNYIPVTSGLDVSFRKPEISSEIAALKKTFTWKFSFPVQESKSIRIQMGIKCKNFGLKSWKQNREAKSRFGSARFSTGDWSGLQKPICPVVRFTSFCVVLAWVLHLDLQHDQVCVITALMHESLMEEIYIEITHYERTLEI